MNILPSPSVGVWECAVGVWCGSVGSGSVVRDCASVGVRVWKCGSGGAGVQVQSLQTGGVQL